LAPAAGYWWLYCTHFRFPLRQILPMLGDVVPAVNEFVANALLGVCL
jgi:hypothetical protein